MPRATLTRDADGHPTRLYTAEISALQRILKLTKDDNRIPTKVRQHISANVAFLVTTLSNAHSPKVDSEL